MRVYKMGPQGLNQHIEKDPSIALDLYLDNYAEVGDVIEITVMEMSQEEFENLPEYDGP